MLARLWRNWNFNPLLVGLQISTSTLENSMEDPQKNRNYHMIQQYHFWVSTQKSGNQTIKLIHVSVFIAAQLTIDKLWNQPRCPSMDEWMTKLWEMYTMEFYSAIKKDNITSFTGKCMELESIMLSKAIQSQKVRNQMVSLIY